MKKILVIEDEAIILLSALTLLRNNGFDVLGAADGSAGVQKAVLFLPDLVLCNVSLPKLRGDEVYRELRQNPATATIPFIFITAQSTSAEIDRLRQLGAEHFFTKPYAPDELLQAIAKILG